MVSPGQTASYQEIWNNRAEIGTTAVEPSSRSRELRNYFYSITTLAPRERRWCKLDETAFVAAR